MKYFTLIFCVILLSSCSDEKKLDGYWYGAGPVLMKFENDTFIDYFSSGDTTKFKHSENKFIFKNAYDEYEEWKIKIGTNELSFYDLESNSVIITLKKSKSNNFIFDYLNDKSLIINLPSGTGLQQKIGSGRASDLPLYLAYKKGLLVANFLDTTMNVDANYYKFLLSKISKISERHKSLGYRKIALIADKDIRIEDINMLKKQLRIINILSIDYHFTSSSYDMINVLSSKLRGLNERDFKMLNTEEISIPPPEPPFLERFRPNLKQELIIALLDGDNLTINDTVLSLNKLSNYLKPKILSGKEQIILYYLTENSTYENFIKFSEIVYNAYYDVRDAYLMKKINKKFRPNYNPFKKEMREVKRKYLINFQQLDSLEFYEIKSKQY